MCALPKGAFAIETPKRGQISPNGMSSLGRSQFNFHPGMPLGFLNEIVCSAFQASTIAAVTCVDGMDLLETFVYFIA